MGIPISGDAKMPRLTGGKSDSYIISDAYDGQRSVIVPDDARPTAIVPAATFDRIPGMGPSLRSCKSDENYSGRHDA